MNDINLKILNARLILYGLLLMESHMYILKVTNLQIAYAAINVNLIRNQIGFDVENRFPRKYGDMKLKFKYS